MKNTILAIAFLSIFATMTAFAADFGGRWKASINTQMGIQNYTYDLHVDGSSVSGTASNDHGSTAILEGKLDGDTITFVEVLSFGGNDVRITYKGKIEGDEIKFVRQVGDFATEEFVAKRDK